MACVGRENQLTDRICILYSVTFRLQIGYVPLPLGGAHFMIHSFRMLDDRRRGVINGECVTREGGRAVPACYGRVAYRLGIQEIPLRITRPLEATLIGALGSSWTA